MPAKNSKPFSKMNTNPDETKMALWLDDELHGDELAAFEATLGDTAANLAAREEVRRWRSLMAAAVPAAVEPPFPDFFNSRVERAIREPVAAKPAAVRETRWGLWWRNVFMPVAACVGMAFTFWLGTRINPRPAEAVAAVPPRMVAAEPVVYTPESGVEAERFSSSPASATVIVLRGVDAIPDDTDFPESTSFHATRHLDALAASETQTNNLIE